MKHYQQLIAEGTITADKDQERIILMLDDLAAKMLTYKKDKKSLINKIFSTVDAPQGLYLHGGVGRGKSMLMDLFFDHLPIKSKRRVHFHGFMLDIHNRIHKLKDKDAGDPIQHVANQIAEESKLLCFDEFQVSDIADAMILGRLFKILFDKGVVVVATSNRHPDDLYKHGLQREQFLPFIAIFKQKMKIIPLNGTTDYRLQHLKSLSTVYYTPLGEDADKFLDNVFNELDNDAESIEGELHVQGRVVKVPKMHGDIAQFSFDDLCKAALGSADYIEIAREFNTILLSDIPQMSKEYRNEAKRFTTLIDELYEHKTKLICTAELPPHELYKQGDNSFEFERTVSRLIEMQSDSYLGEEHLG